jgi:ribosomal protein S7
LELYETTHFEQPSVEKPPMFTKRLSDAMHAHATKIMRSLFQREEATAPLAVKKKVHTHASLKKHRNAVRVVAFFSAHAQKNPKHQSSIAFIKSEQKEVEMEVKVALDTPSVDMQHIPMLAKCISFIMKRGHKAKAASTMNKVITMLQSLAPQKKEVVHALDMIHVAINNVKPAFELRKARFGGRTQFIPATMPVHKQENQALRAIVQTARAKHKKAASTNKHHDMYSFAYFLAQEINDAYKHQGAACQAKHGTHKQAEHNRNHVRRRWW